MDRVVVNKTGLPQFPPPVVSESLGVFFTCEALPFLGFRWRSLLAMPDFMKKHIIQKKPTDGSGWPLFAVNSTKFRTGLAGHQKGGKA